MSQTTPIQPNTVSALNSHRLISKTIHVEAGHLNILIGEHLMTLHNGESIVIPQGICYAIANLSPSATFISETIAQPTFADDADILADATGRVFASDVTPSMQASLSLYMGLLDMRIEPTIQRAA